MFPVILAGVAAVATLFLTGCSKDKKQEKVLKESFRDTDLTANLSFFQVSPKVLWHDTNGDGKRISQETFNKSFGESALQAAKNYIQKNPSLKPACNHWEPEIIPGSMEPHFEHPEKERVAWQLNLDIDKLTGMNPRPKYFDALLQDLKMIRQELPHVLFRYAEAGEVPAGFLGSYDDLSGEMLLVRGAPMSLIVHELDHRLTWDRRVEEWSVPYGVLCSDGQVRNVPKLPYLPEPAQAQTHFEISLDYYGQGQNQLSYRDTDYWAPMLHYLKTGRDLCLETPHKEASLASEVQGYLTMARYLLLQVGFSESQIQAIREGSPSEGSRAKGDLKSGLQRELKGSSLNPDWAYDLLLHYFGKGGSNGLKNLTTFVDGYYSRMGAPGFADPPNCQN